MKRIHIISIILVVVMIMGLTACGMRSDVARPSEVEKETPEAAEIASTPEVAELNEGVVAATTPENEKAPGTTMSSEDEKNPDITTAPVVVAPTATPAPEATKAPQVPQTPAPTAKPAEPTAKPQNPTPALTAKPADPTPAPHTHSWVEVTKTVHHDAVTEEVWVVDTPATPGWTEKVEHADVKCRCGATFSSGSAFLAHQNSFSPEEMFENHGGCSGASWYEDVWHEGTPEKGHTETRVVKNAYDEVVVTCYKCACGATK